MTLPWNIIKQNKTVKMKKSKQPELELELTDEYKPPKIRTNYNRVKFATDAEINNQEDKTIPGQAFTVDEIIARMASGQSDLLQSVPVFNGEDEEYPDFAKLDLQERKEYLEHVKERIDKAKIKMAEMQKDQAKRKKAKWMQEFKEWQEQQKLDEPVPASDAGK